MKIKEFNTLAIVSILLVFGSWFYPVFFKFQGCACEALNILSLIGAVSGLISLVWIKIKKEKGYLLAILAIIFGVIGYIALVCV